MGERANIVIQESTYGDKTTKPSRVWLYGHWIGPRTLEVAQQVIERGERLGDESYLARIVFEAMIPTDQRGDGSSYGISTRMTDNNYPIIVLNPEDQTAWIEDAEWGKPLKPVTKKVPMAEFGSAVSAHGRDFDAVIALLK